MQNSPVSAVRLAERERMDPYFEWRRKEGVTVGGGLSIPDVRKVELAHWPRKGVNGAAYYLDGDDEEDEHIIEIPSGGSSTPEHHMYDEAVYVLSGRGTAHVWWNESHKQSFEWGEGSFFALPMNVRYQLFNGSSSEAARYLSVTNLPAMLRQFHNEEFVFNCSSAFTDRYSSVDSYFRGEGKLYRGRYWETNFVADVRRAPVLPHEERGGGSANIGFSLAGGAIAAHVSRFQSGMYKKGHRQGAHSHFYILEGEGYSLAQRRGEPWVRVDWTEGSLLLSGAGPGQWLNQHFNVGSNAATYLVTHVGPTARYTTIRWNVNDPTWITDGSIDERVGGRQVEYEDEDPEIHPIFEQELARRGLDCRMRSVHPGCTGVA